MMSTWNPAPPPTHRRFLDMMPDEIAPYLYHLQDQLTRKQARERAYLDRRARRGTHTATDDEYEADQQLETDLLALLDDLLQAANEQPETKIHDGWNAGTPDDFSL